MKKERKWLPHFGELIDRLAIHQLKEVFFSEYKDKYAREMKLIENDIDLIIEEKSIEFTAKMIRAIICIAQINTHIWYNEAKARRGEKEDIELLRLTHGLNGLRVKVSNYILKIIGDKDRVDFKTDCLAAEFKDWEISLEDDNTNKTNGKEA